MADSDFNTPINNQEAPQPPAPSDPAPQLPPESPKSNKMMIVAIAAAVVVVLGIILAVVLTQNKANETTTPGDTSSSQQELLESEAYTDQEHHLSIKYPKGWQVADEPDQGNYITIENPQADTVAGKGYQARVNVSYETTPSTLDSYVQAALDVFPSVIPDFTLISNESTTVDGVPAKVLTYTTKDASGTAITSQQVIFVKNGTAYTTTGLAATEKWSSYEAAFNASLSSIKLL